MQINTITNADKFELLLILTVRIAGMIAKLKEIIIKNKINKLVFFSCFFDNLFRMVTILYFISEYAPQADLA